MLTLPSGADVGTVCLAASRGLQRFTVVLLMMNGLASPRGISANPVRAQMITPRLKFKEVCRNLRAKS